MVERKIQNFKLRPVSQDDIQLIFGWANDKEVRENSFHTEPIDWKTHVVWFKEKLSNPEKFRIFIAEFDGEPVGQIRFDRERDAIKINFLVDGKFRGCGFGKAILREGLAEVQRIWKKPNRFIGEVKKFNVSSWKIFENLEFEVRKKNTKFEFKRNFAETCEKEKL